MPLDIETFGLELVEFKKDSTLGDAPPNDLDELELVEFKKDSTFRLGDIATLDCWSL